MTHQSSRRDFLRGKAAADAVADKVTGQTVADNDAPDAGLGGGYTLRVGHRAMACQFEVCLNVGQYAHGADVAMEALDLVDRLEEQLSFFRPSSELSKINALAADGPLAVEPGLFGLLELAAKIHRETEGAFDLTATPLWELWGFSRRAGVMPAQAQIDDALQLVGGRLVELDRDQGTVRLLRPGVRLNLGAIGKGYALDRCAEALKAAGIAHFLLSGGYSSMIAAGDGADVPRPAAGTPPSAAGGWLVGVRNPLRPDRRLGELRVRDRALATSGSYVQSFRFGGKRYGHILDPRSGWPADSVLSTTVLAPTAALADALSTAFYVLGWERTAEFCAARPELAAIVICPSRGSGGMSIHSIGLSESDLQLYAGHTTARD